MTLKRELPGAEALKKAKEGYDFIDLAPQIEKEQTLKEWLKIDSVAEEILFYAGLLGIVAFCVFLAFEVIRILPKVPGKLNADVSISQSAISQVEAQAKIANVLTINAQTNKEILKAIGDLQFEVRKSRLDNEEWARRERKELKKLLPRPSVLYE